MRPAVPAAGKPHWQRGAAPLPCGVTLHRLDLTALAIFAWTSGTAIAEPLELPLLVLPLRVHLLQSTNQPQVHTTLAEADVRRILGKVNGIWAQARIRFELEKLLKEPAQPAEVPGENPKDRWLLSVVPPMTRATNAFNVYYVKKMQPNGYWSGGVAFVKDTASLKEVPGGIDEPLPRVTAHELGHALGLSHRQDRTNLMASGTTGTALSEEEIQRARAAAGRISWVKKASTN